MSKVRINFRLYFFLLGVALIAISWRGGEWVNNARLSNLPVMEAPKVDIGATSINTKSFYPAWVKQSVAQPSPTEETSTVDEVFKGKEVQVPPPAPPSYADTFRQNARIDGITDSGVFINGRFYRAHEKLEALAIQGGAGEMVVPVIESVSVHRIVFRVGKETLSITQR